MDAEWTCPALVEEYNDLLGDPTGTEADIVETDGGEGTHGGSEQRLMPLQSYFSHANICVAAFVWIGFALLLYGFYLWSATTGRGRLRE